MENAAMTYTKYCCDCDENATLDKWFPCIPDPEPNSQPESSRRRNVYRTAADRPELGRRLLAWRDEVIRHSPVPMLFVHDLILTDLEIKRLAWAVPGRITCTDDFFELLPDRVGSIEWIESYAYKILEILFTYEAELLVSEDDMEMSG